MSAPRPGPLADVTQPTNIPTWLVTRIADYGLAHQRLGGAGASWPPTSPEAINAHLDALAHRDRVADAMWGALGALLADYQQQVAALQEAVDSERHDARRYEAEAKVNAAAAREGALLRQRIDAALASAERAAVEAAAQAYDDALVNAAFDANLA